MSGDSGNDMLSGGLGNDTLLGGSGDDKISGDAGNDIISGGLGRDTLTGDFSDKHLEGNRGNDTFQYLSINDSLSASPDKITDFETGSDKIDISSLKKINNCDVMIKLVNKFSKQKNEMMINYNKTENLTKLLLDHDGDGQAEFQIDIIGTVDPIKDIII
ncbi:M10 family metallopeptidase C-terminal domain-containing protein [Arsenophonus nasoniae]